MNQNQKIGIAAAIAGLLVIVGGLGIKSHLDRQAAIAEEQRQYELRRQALLQQRQQEKFVEEQEQKAKAFGRLTPTEEQRIRQRYCANPKAYPAETNLYKYAAELKAQKLGQPIPTTEQVIASECAGVSPAASAASPSPLPEIEPVTPSPSP
jgi:hypothetical protein